MMNLMMKRVTPLWLQYVYLCHLSVAIEITKAGRKEGQTEVF